MLNSPPCGSNDSGDTDICAAGLGLVRVGPVADDLDAAEAAACTHRRLELETAKADLELRREALRELVLRHKLWRQNGTVLFVALLMGRSPFARTSRRQRC